MPDIVRRRPAAIEPVPVEPGCAKDLIAVWLAHYSTDNSRRSMLGSLKLCCRVIGLSDPRSVRWWDLTRTHMVAIRLGLAQHVAANPRGLSTAQHALTGLRGLLRECWLQGLLAGERYELLRAVEPIRGSREKRGRALEGLELGVILGTLERSSNATAARAGCVFALGYGCGLRRHEIAAARAEDLAADCSELTLIGKGNKQRTVPIPEEVRRVIRVWISHRGPGPGALICRIGGNFMPLSPVTIWRIFKKLLAEARLPTDLAPHDLRRSYISALLEAGVDLTTVAGLVGHSNVSTTAGYDRRPAKLRAKAVEKLPFG